MFQLASELGISEHLLARIREGIAYRCPHGLMGEQNGREEGQADYCRQDGYPELGIIVFRLEPATSADAAAHDLKPENLGMSTEPDGAGPKARAEALFKRQTQGETDESRQAQEAAKAAEAEKTAKLRALRLAKEESDRVAAAVRRTRREQRRP